MAQLLRDGAAAPGRRNRHHRQTSPRERQRRAPARGLGADLILLLHSFRHFGLFCITVMAVPALLVSHALVFWLLLRRPPPAREAAAA